MLCLGRVSCRGAAVPRLIEQTPLSTVQVDDLVALALAAGANPVAVQAVKSRELY